MKSTNSKLRAAGLIQIAAVSLIALLFTSCIGERIEGNYHLITEEREVRPFDDVMLTGNIQAEIIPSDEVKVIIKGESNVLPYLQTKSDGVTLTIGFRNGYNIHENYSVEVKIYTPVLQGIRVSGSGNVYSGMYSADYVFLEVSGSGSISCGFDAEAVEARISGSGRIFAEGWASTGQYRVSGSGNIDASDLLLSHCNARISGSGNIRTSVSSVLDANISGSGNVYYKGNPEVFTQISGSGKVIRF